MTTRSSRRATAGRSGSRNVVATRLQPARDLAGLPDALVFHDLRHAAASRLLNAGVDPVMVASILGHGDPGVTLRVYAHVFRQAPDRDAVRAALAMEA